MKKNYNIPTTECSLMIEGAQAILMVSGPVTIGGPGPGSGARIIRR